MKSLNIRKNNMIRGFLFAAALSLAVILFTSCDNFLKAREVKDEVEDTIAYNNAKIVPVNLFCDKEMGSIYPQGTYNAHLGFAFELQFVPNPDNYIINGDSSIFEAVSRFSNAGRSDCVEIIPVEQSIEDKRVGLYRAKVKVVKASDDIMLRPCPGLVPKVVNISPANNAAGYPQDSTIRITFNKPVDPESFGFFSCIKILNGSNKDMSSYYGTPYFSNDNTVLNIAAAPGKSIIEDGSASDYEDITISINFTDITDAQGIQIAQNNAYTFRLNKSKDTANPVLNSIVLKTTSDSSAQYYHALNEKVFEEWTDSQTAQYPYGDFSQNHVGASFYIEASGYDKDSGVNGIQVKETFYKTVTGDETSLSTKTGICGINKQVFLETDTSNNEVYSMNDTYTFVTKGDGVFKLEISILDNAGHTSEAKPFYVIKDSTIDSNAIKFEETKTYDNYHPDDPTTDDDSYTDIFNIARSSNKDTDTVKLTLLESSGDAFYRTYVSSCDVEVYYGNSENAINSKAQRVNDAFTFTTNSDAITFVKILASDDIGNKVSFIRAIPPKPVISNYTTSTYSGNKDLKINLFSQLSQEYGSDSSGFFYVVRNNDLINTNFGALPRSSDNCLEIIDYYGSEGIDGSYKNLDVFVVAYLKYGDAYWCSVLSDDFVTMNAKIDDSGKRLIDGKPTSSLSIDGKTNGDWETYMHDNIQITTESYELNSGFSEVTVFDFKEPAAEGVELAYTYICEDYNDPNSVFYFSEPTFIIPSMRKYILKIQIEEINGSNYYISPWLYVRANGASTYLQGVNYSFNLTEDTFAPIFPNTNSVHDFTQDSPVFWAEQKADYPIDGPISPTAGSAVGLAETTPDSGIGVMDYYFIPDSNVHTNEYTVYTMQDLLAYENEKHRLEYSFTDSYFKIPYNYLDDGLYTLCLVAKDKNGNYAIKCAPAFNKVLDSKAPVVLKKINSSTVRFSSNVEFKIERYMSSTNTWTSYSVSQSNNDWGCPFSSTSNIPDWFKISGIKEGQDVFDSGYYLVDYAYFPYLKTIANPSLTPLTFTSKEVIECLTGYHVYCNYPVLIHTMYCSKKLTETTTDKDSAIWETKGEETGFMVKSGDYSYTSENYRDIPAGYYYTTIFHFADGQTVMTPIKQK